MVVCAVERSGKQRHWKETTKRSSAYHAYRGAMYSIQRTDRTSMSMFNFFFTNYRNDINILLYSLSIWLRVIS